jgi:class 3 adenylate cyclase
VAFWPARLATSTRRSGLVATLTLTFLFTDIESFTAMVRRPVGVWLKDLGLHRPKGVGQPEQIFQLQAEGLPTAAGCGRWATRRC